MLKPAPAIKRALTTQYRLPAGCSNTIGRFGKSRVAGKRPAISLLATV
jgi:hypothetical protein